MRRTCRAVGVGCLLAMAIAACAEAPGESCAQVAGDYGPEFVVVGAFSTNVSRARSVQPAGGEPPWPSAAPDDPAVICFLDGPFPRSAPGGALPATRAIVGIVDGQSLMLAAGPRDALPVRPP